jgi:hypothetical protein
MVHDNSPHSAWIHILDDDSLINSVDRPSLKETRVMPMPWDGENGTANDGGTGSHKFAKDGET